MVDLIATGDDGPTALSKLNAAITAINAIAAQVASALSSISGETTTRANADTAEANARASGDQGLGQQIATETAARGQADSGLQATLETEIANEKAARIQSFTTLSAGLAALTQAVAGKATQSDLAALTQTVASKATQADLADLAQSVLAKASQTDLAGLQQTVLGKVSQSDLAALSDRIAGEIGVETEARLASIALFSSVFGTASLAHPTKPGDNPFFFTSSLIGLASDAPPLPSLGIVTSLSGKVYRLTGQQTIATRRTIWVEPGRVTAVRFDYARFSAPSDPSNDSIVCGIACLDQNGALLSTIAIDTNMHPAPSAGMRVISARVPSQIGDPVAIVLPAGCVEWRPFIKAFGLDAVTDWIAISSTDITAAGTYSPDLTATNNRVTALETEVTALNPVSTGVPNGLATLDSSGTIAQLPMLKSAWIEAAAVIVPDAAALLDNAVSSLPASLANASLTNQHFKNPYVAVGSAWAAFAQATLGLSTAQLASIFATIGSAAQRAGAVQPIVVYDLGTTTASVLRSALVTFGSIPNAVMTNFFATLGDQNTDNYFALTDPHAPVGGALYGLLLQYLTSTDSGAPGLSTMTATARLTTIWANSINHRQ